MSMEEITKSQRSKGSATSERISQKRLDLDSHYSDQGSTGNPVSSHRRPSQTSSAILKMSNAAQEEPNSFQKEPNSIKEEPYSIQKRPISTGEEPTLIQEQSNSIQNQSNLIQEESKSIQNQSNLIQNEPNSIQNEPNSTKEEPNSSQNDPNSAQKEKTSTKEDSKSIQKVKTSIKEDAKSIQSGQKSIQKGPDSNSASPTDSKRHDKSPISKSDHQLQSENSEGSSWKDASLTMDTSTIRESEEETISQYSDDDRSTEIPIRDRMESHVQFEDISLKSDSETESEVDRRESLTERKRRFSFFQSTCLKDGIRPIDIVLSYVVHDCKKKTKRESINVAYRQKFESSLIEQGFELEYEEPRKSFDGKTGFVKVHAPFSVLERQAELRTLQKPFREADIDPEKPSWWKRLTAKLCGKDPFGLQEIYQKQHQEYFTDVFDRERRKDFLNCDDELAFFTEAQRIYLTWDAISSTCIKLKEDGDGKNKEMQVDIEDIPGDQKSMSEDEIDQDQDSDQHQENAEDNAQHQEKNKDDAIEEPLDPVPPDQKLSEDLPEDSIIFGHHHHHDKGVTFHSLLQMGAYHSGYPLHDSNLDDDPELTSDQMSDWPLRKYLYESWARPRQWRRYQPIQTIRDYYGEKVALYFAWIGFYTKMLIVPAILGVIVTIYGLISIPFNDIAETVCKDHDVANVTICPSCPTTACPYTQIRNFCTMAKIGAVFDNNITVLFSVFIAIWAVCFLEMWKRYKHKLCVDWDVTDEEFSAETVRPEYALRVPDMKLNPVTMQMEPHLKALTRLKRILASLATVLFFISVVMGLVAAVMVYKLVGPVWWRIWLKDRDSASAKGGRELQEYNLIVSVTSAVLNGIFIAIMTKVYMGVAWGLTQAEFPRTDREFERSYTYKVFIFQCVNFYGALFYLALVRGRVSEPPHMQKFESGCPISGCIVDVSIQLGIIFVGNQAINNILELGIPLLQAFYRRLKRHRAQKKNDTKNQNYLPVWERDFQMREPEKVLLFSDYLELLIQYGFTTMFVAAFPLAPLFALLNNIVEIRLDAYKNLVLTQRCIPLRAKNIGPWYSLLVVITRLAVLTNALLVAFTTKFIDRLMFEHIDGNEWREVHHVNKPKDNLVFFTLSSFNVSDAVKGGHSYASHLMSEDVKKCYYVDYRHSPHDPVDPYGRSQIWWHVLAARLIFVILFEHFVFFFQSILVTFIPDVTKRDKIRMAREQHLIKQNFMQREFGNEKKQRKIVEEYDGDDFVPDEMPEWLTKGKRPTDREDTNRQLPPPISEQSGCTQVKTSKRGKIIVKNPPHTKRPFVMMLFRKLMLCD